MGRIRIGYFMMMWAGCATAQAPIVIDSLEKAGLIETGTGRVEARFRADATNWDMRLAFDGTPKPTDTTANVLDGRGAFADSTFGFTLEYAADESVYAFQVTRPDGRVQAIKAEANGVDAINAIMFATTGSRGKVSLWDVVMKGPGFYWSGMNDLTSSPWAVTRSDAILYFGDRFDLTSTDWFVAGNLSFGAFSTPNPSEGAKVTINLFNAIPAPASGCLVGMASGLVLIRRR